MTLAAGPNTSAASTPSGNEQKRDGAGRTAAVVEDVLTRAAHAGERAVCFARLCLCGMILVAWPIATWDALRSGTVMAIAVVMVTAFIGVTSSLWILLHLTRRDTTVALSTFSISLDVTIVIVMLSAFVWENPPDYKGVGRLTGIGFLYFAIVAAGIRLTRRGGVIAAVIATAGVGLLGVADWSLHRIVDDPANWVVIVVLLIGAAVFAWLIAARTRTIALEGAQQTLFAERARARLGAYVSQEVAAAALTSEVLKLGGSRQTVAVLFTDLRDFTSTAESAEPEQLVEDLNAYFEAMVAAILSHGGVVDKYIGDSIMAVFGAPVSKADDAARAVCAAHAMDAALVTLNASRVARGRVPLRHGIGVHLGIVVAGNIGTAERAQYTVIGDTVNVAARLEAATKHHGVSVLISQAVINAVGSQHTIPELHRVGPIVLKGRAEPVMTYTFAPSEGVLAGAQDAHAHTNTHASLVHGDP